MLNHLRPRQTKWAYDSRRQQFIITSLVPLCAGQQVYDSYGKKCNRCGQSGVACLCVCFASACVFSFVCVCVVVGFF